MRHLVLAGALLVAGGQADGWQAERTRALELRLAGKTAEAVAVLERAVKRWPAEADAHYELGDALLQATWEAEANEAAAPARAERLKRAATHLRRAMTLNQQYRQLALAKLVTVYDEDALNAPAQVETLARELQAMDPASGVWAMRLAHSLAAQGKCSEGARTLLAARTKVAPDRRFLLAMQAPGYLLKCDGLALADARPLLEAAEAVAAEELKRLPENRDAVQLQAAALTALGGLLPSGPEKTAIERRATAAFERFMELNPTRRRALAGEPPESIDEGFAYIIEFETAGKVAEARRLLTNMEKQHSGSADFWRRAIGHYQLSDAPAAQLAAAERYVALAPRDPQAHVLLAGVHMDRAQRDGAKPGERAASFKAADAALTVALKLAPDDIGAMLGRSDLLAAQAAHESDPARKEALLRDAKAWRQKAAAQRR